MRIAMLGLGRMGLNMARRLLGGGHEVVAWNRSPGPVEALAAQGAVPAFSLEEAVAALPGPRTLWLMLPAQVVDEHLDALRPLLAPGDLLVDGGNSPYKADPGRGRALAEAGLLYVDAGVSGGIWGLTEGYCTMVGGPPEAYERLRPALDTLAPPGGHMHCGPHGAGHYAKMIHNGIEYGMMQAYAEGFALLEASPYGPGLDLGALARLWNRGSVVRSWLLELVAAALERDPALADVAPYVEDSGEGRWAVDSAVELGVPAPVLALSLMARFRSRQDNAFADRLLAALRGEFGGHAVRRPGEEQP